MHVWVVRQARKILNFGKVVLQPSRQYYSSQPAVKITITHHFFMLFYIWHNINVSQTIFYWYFMYLRIIVKFCKIYLINSFKLSFFFFLHCTLHFLIWAWGDDLDVEFKTVEFSAFKLGFFLKLQSSGTAAGFSCFVQTWERYWLPYQSLERISLYLNGLNC